MLPFVEVDLKKIAARVLESAKDLCVSKSVRNPDTLLNLTAGLIIAGSWL